MTSYLDTKKSVLISSPAGSGKTEKLARRYVCLLEHGAEPEKVLAITFTEKAAAEMKERVLNILLREKEEMFHRLKEKVPLMRITTIHAFCRKLLTRFSLELGLDPSLDVLDEQRAARLWAEAVYDTLRQEQDSPSFFFDYLKTKGVKGWGILYSTLAAIHSRRPYSEMLLDACGQTGALSQGGAASGLSTEECSLLELYRRCFETYRKRKTGLGVIDFNDMEMLAYRAITNNPQWLNILYAFDEHTDHILVDEFQDTSSLQWKIIDKLTEEWRSGLGAKRASGKTPTIFLVGDEKQSIYLFRGANVSIFRDVKERMEKWLGCEAVYFEEKQNYRSLPNIIEMANRLFSRIMPGADGEAWRTRYAPFQPTREGDGTIELLLVEQDRNTRRTRLKEAGLTARKIASLVGSLEVKAEGGRGKCRYSDIAVLLRKRTHLSAFENSFRECGIPYIVLGGIGFYEEPEVALLSELVSFLADPEDDFSLFTVLRSPLFGVPESSLFGMLPRRGRPIYQLLEEAGSARLREAHLLLGKYLSKAEAGRLAVLIEEFLAETGGWRIFWETQRHANIKKFLRIIEGYEGEALSLFEIKEKLIRARKSSEPKANVNPERLDAVRIMTIHGSKGLQFPVVFLPCLDEAPKSGGGAVLMEEAGQEIRFAYEEDSLRRKDNRLFVLQKEKEQEEEKRLFYVAVTRAMDHLFLSGAVREEGGAAKAKGKLALLEEAFPGCVSQARSQEGLFRVCREREFAAGHDRQKTALIEETHFLDEPVFLEPVGPQSGLRWVEVTEDIEIRTKHGEDWAVLGSLFHRLFEELSKGVFQYRDLSNRAAALLSRELSLSRRADRYRKIIEKDFRGLEEAGLLADIILPSAASHAELPFVLEKGGRVYSGRVDRVIVRRDTAFIYDYKTYPVSEREVAELKEKYRFQLGIYAEACRELFSLKTRSFLLFTHRPLLVEL